MSLRYTAILVLAASAALLVPATNAQAADGTWVLLGKRTVNHLAERDVILVTGVPGKFNALQLRVANRGIQFLDLKIHYGNGATQDVVVRTTIPAGGKTRVLDLPGDARTIVKVDLTYRTRGLGRQRATVNLWGRRVPDSVPVAKPPVVVPPKPTLSAWILLGSRHVNFGKDRDIIPVSGAAGRFRKLQIEVLENGIEVIDLKVRFGNDTFVDYAIKTFIAAGKRTRVLDLPGDERVIKFVNLLYRTRGIRVGRALVKVWGQKEITVAPTPVKPPVVKPPAPAAGTWVFLGSRRVKARAERDVIVVTGNEGLFRKIQLKVTGKPVEIIDLKVHFGDGGTFDVALRAVIPAGGSTRVIDLPGGARVIRKVTMVYRHRGRVVGQPLVSLYGMH